MLRREDGLQPAPTFSARCIDPQIDEWPYIKPMLDRTGASNTDFYPDEDDLLSNLDHVVWHMDEPFHTAAVFAQWKLATLARSSGVTVLLDGQGGDEALAGLRIPSVPRSLLHVSHTRSHRAGGLGGEVPSPDPGDAAASVPERGRQGVPSSAAFAARSRTTLVAWTRPRRRCRAARSLAHHLYGLSYTTFADVQPSPRSEHDVGCARGTQPAPRLPDRRVWHGARTRGSSCTGATRNGRCARQSLAARSEVVDRKRKQGFATDESHWMRGDSGDLMAEAVLVGPPCRTSVLRPGRAASRSSKATVPAKTMHPSCGARSSWSAGSSSSSTPRDSRSLPGRSSRPSRHDRPATLSATSSPRMVDRQPERALLNRSVVLGCEPPRRNHSPTNSNRDEASSAFRLEFARARSSPAKRLPRSA